MYIIREVSAPDRTKDKAMKICLFWILFLGQTIADATILSHVIPIFRPLVSAELYEKRLREYSFSECLE
jgi:hypothetical protein